MNFTFIALISVFIAGAQAQTEDLNARDPRLNEGKLFTVTFTPKAKKIAVSLAGKPQAELGPDRVVVFGREIRSNGEARTLTVKPSAEGFEIVEPVDANQPVEIEVRDRQNSKKKETFRFGKP